jgi:hypothetical protein
MVSVLRTSQYYDIDALAADVASARRILDFGAGTYEHSISLPAEDDINAAHRTHRNNNPYAGALGACPLFAEIFNSFQADKACYRLLRRKAGTAYSLHDDKDVDVNLIRMQMPVVTNGSALLLVQKDGAELEPIARRVEEFVHDDDQPIMFDYTRYADVFGEWFDAFLLEPGYFHLIDPTRVHTLINAGNDERVTLCIDMLRNDWLDDWLAENMGQEVPALPAGSLPTGTWEWGSLRHGLLTHPRVQLN